MGKIGDFLQMLNLVTRSVMYSGVNCFEICYQVHLTSESITNITEVKQTSRIGKIMAIYHINKIPDLIVTNTDITIK